MIGQYRVNRAVKKLKRPKYIKFLISEQEYPKLIDLCNRYFKTKSEIIREAITIYYKIAMGEINDNNKGN